MKNIIYILTFILFSNYSFTENYNFKLSPLGNDLLKSKNISELQSSNYINSIIIYNNDFSFESVKSLGARISTITPKTFTARLPINRLSEISNLNGIVYIDLEKTAGIKMDSARSITGIERIISGINSEIPSFTGNGVVIGIVDAGFDYTHPAFYNTDSNRIIISRVWDQGKSGISPAEFGYGAEYKTQEEILAVEKDINDFSHGTHVASIACGQLTLGAEDYFGAARDAELVIVAVKPPAQEQWYNAGAADFADAVKYVFDYAESVNKPAIVNLSWGGQMGPHDGTSPFSQTIDAVTGKGKIFAASAGNDGQVNLHINKKFTETDTALITYFSNHYDKSRLQGGIWLDAWAEAQDSIVYILEILNPFTKDILFSTDSIYSYINFSDTYNYQTETDTCKIELFSKYQEYNQKPHFFINISANKELRFRLKAFSKDAEINIWNWFLFDYVGIEKPFVKFGDENAVMGDNNYTISDFASTKNAIAVGAMVSKSKYTDENGALRSFSAAYSDIAPFSSKGAVNSEIIKPDITAPGMGLTAAVSTFDSEYFPQSGSTSVITRIDYNDKKYPYAILSGTSMSCPLASGAIALLLSIKNDLTPSEIIKLLAETATIDSFTGEVPNNTWGNGKLNLYEAAKSLFIKTDVKENLTNKIVIYPNPASEIISIDINEVDFNLEIFNGNFESVKDINIRNRNERIDVSDLASGQYYLLVRKAGKAIYRGFFNKIQ